MQGGLTNGAHLIDRICGQKNRKMIKKTQY